MKGWRKGRRKESVSVGGRSRGVSQGEWTAVLEQCSAQSELSQRDHTHPGFSAPTGMIEVKVKVKWKELENEGNK